jgi:hypothetical protein
MGSKSKRDRGCGELPKDEALVKDRRIDPAEAVREGKREDELRGRFASEINREFLLLEENKAKEGHIVIEGKVQRLRKGNDKLNHAVIGDQAEEIHCGRAGRQSD